MRFLRKDTEQYHLTLGAPGLARDDERRFALRVLDNILGGTSSSRLFQEVRERRGLAYNVFSFQSLFAHTGQIGIYLGTRPDNVAPALQVVADELARLRRDGFTADELERSKENVKGRMVLSLESTAARMNRLGNAVLSDLPLLTLDEAVDRIEAVTLDDLAALTDELLAPERLSAAGVGTDEDVFRSGDRAARVGGRDEGLGVSLLRVAVAGAAGRMGQAVCAAVEGAEDMELTGRADPALGTSLADVLGDADVVVDFTRPDTALANALECVAAGVHVVIGTSGFDIEPLYEARGANVFFGPNFAIGAVLMMRFAAEASKHMAKAEIVELHHDGKLDKPSGTAARTAELMEGDVPIHSVRLPGLVASPGGHPRRPRPDADDPPRLDRPRVVHAGRPARRAARARPHRVPGDRARAPAVLERSSATA